jgi:uncharacterized protein CbrC (UPF0167 family)
VRQAAFVYRPVLRADGLDDALCHVASPTGRRTKFNATFVDDAGFDGGGEEAMTNHDADAQFSSPEQWMDCCDDGMAFVEPFGATELQENTCRQGRS